MLGNSLVSVIIPAWNVEKYIFRALDSCIAQSYKNLEIILVDDGSDDGTIEIVKKYQEKDKRIRLIQRNHEGVSAARNAGIENAQGQKIVFLDSDDWMTVETVQLLMEYSIRYPQYLIGGSPLFIDEGYEEKNGIDHADKNFEAVVLNKNESLMNTDTQKYRNASVQYKLFDLETILKYNIYFDKEILYGEDGLFVFEYLYHVNGMVYLDTNIWNYLVRKKSSTRGWYNEKFMTSIYAVEKMMDYSENSSDEIRNMLESFVVVKALNMFRRYLNSGEKRTETPLLYKAYIKKYKKAYLKRASLAEKIRTNMIVYMPYGVYEKIYKKKHYINEVKKWR
mgnify:CR=1 FL=1